MKAETVHTPYSHIWNKYRPVILRLMVDSENGPQHYSFSDHEFTRVFPKKRDSLAFILFLHRSKALNNIKSSPLAQSLLAMLRESKTVERLTEDLTFEFMLDDKFLFHVRRNEALNDNDAAANPAAAIVSSVEE